MYARCIYIIYMYIDNIEPSNLNKPQYVELVKRNVSLLVLSITYKWYI